MSRIKAIKIALAAAAAALALASCQLAMQGQGKQFGAAHATPRWASTGVALDFVTGGGWFIIQPYQLGTYPGARANFGFHGGVKNGEWWGNGTYVDHGIGLHVKVTSVTGYERLGEDGTDSQGHPTGTREICGYADTDLYGPVKFLVQVTDNGEPGSRDTFAIVLGNKDYGYYVYGAEGSLGDPTPGGGNVQLHRGNASNTAPSTPPDCMSNPF